MVGTGRRITGLLFGLGRQQRPRATSRRAALRLERLEDRFAPAMLTTTDLMTSDPTTVFGEPITLSATVSSSPTPPNEGSVTFVDVTASRTLGTVNVTNGLADLVVNDVTVGVHTLEATFNATANFDSSSDTVGQTVAPGMTTTFLTSSQNPSVTGDLVTFTATVTANAPSTLPPAGSVSIVDTTTGTTLGSGSPNAMGQFSVSTSSLAVGMHTIQATFTDPTGNYAGSSGSIDQDVNPITTTTTLTSSKNPSGFSESVTFTAFVSAAPNPAVPTGSVVFNLDGNDVDTKSVDGMGRATFTTDTLPLGPHTLFARYVSDTVNFSNSDSNNLTQQVDPITTTTMLASSDSNSFPGQTVTFTATVSSAGATPTGSVTFKIDGGNDRVVGLNAAGQASFTTSTLPLGMHTITADYTSDNIGFTNSSAQPLTQTVSSVTTTTTLTSSDDASFPGQPVTFTATVSAPEAGTPTGSVTFKIDGGNDRVVGLNAAGQASFTTSTLSLGMHTITADYTSDTIVFTNSSATPLTQTVSSVATTTMLTSSDSNSFPGQSVTFTATVSAPEAGTPTGSVTFRVDGGGSTVVGLNGAGQAMLTTSTLPLGMHTITADYNSNTLVFANSSAPPLTQTVSQVVTTTSLSSSLNPSLPGQTVTFTAAVSAPEAGTPTGSVTFRVDGGGDVVVSLNGTGLASFMTSTLIAGTHLLTADYTSDTIVFANSSAPPLTQTVNPFATVTVLSSSGDNSRLGQPVTFTATVSVPGSSAVPTGTVTFLIDGATVFSPLDDSGRASFTTPALSVGLHTITADYASDSPNFTGSSAALQSQSVRRDYFAVGSDAGVAAQVKVYDAVTGAEVITLSPFGGFGGGVRVAVGDVNGDGFADIITSAGPGAGPHVKVFSGVTFGELASFFAYGAGFNGGVTVAAGDINGDGRADVITGAGPGAGPHVKAFSGATFGELASFFAYGGFSGGVTVAAGDVNGDGRADIITGTASGFTHVKVFSGASLAELASYFAYGNFPGGVNVAAGDVNGDGRADVITGAASAVTHVKVFDGLTLGERLSFLGYPGAPVGVRVGAVDRNGDGRADVITAAAQTPHVKVFDGLSLAVLDSFFAYGPVGGLARGTFVAGG